MSDTPDSFDPFTYISNEPAQSYKGTWSKVIIGAFNVTCLHGTTAQTTTPAAAAAPIPVHSTITTDTASPGSTLLPKSRASGPKIAFPIPHLAELFALIHGNTQIKPVLVAQLHQKFEAVTTKAAIEAKVKEVALREGRTKDSRWQVKHEAWVSSVEIHLFAYL